MFYIFFHLDTLPKSLKGFGCGVFRNCTSLKEIVIPDGVMTISQEAFMGCTNLEKIVLPMNLRYVLPRAFQDCNNLCAYFK